MNLANEISTLESELQSLRSENEVLKHNKAIIEFENESLRRALAKAQADRDNFMRRAEAIKSLLDQTGANLVAGINKYHESERELQERQLAADADPDLPIFLTNGSGMHADDTAKAN
jgi:regulator of replication initiation timing